MHDMVQPDTGYNKHPTHAGLFSVSRPKAIHRLARLQKGKHQWAEAKQILDAPPVLALLLAGCVPSLCISLSLPSDGDKMFSQMLSSSDTLWFNSSSKSWETPVPWSEWLHPVLFGCFQDLSVLLGKYLQSFSISTGLVNTIFLLGAEIERCEPAITVRNIPHAR